MGVTLLKRRLPSGNTGLYLDISAPGEKRRREALHYVLRPGEKYRRENKETEKMAEEVRAMRELELRRGLHGVVGNRREKSFLDYCREIGKNKRPQTRRTWNNAVNQLEDFVGGDVSFGSLDRKMLEGFKAYLLEGRKASTAATIFGKIRAAIRLAMQEGILQEDPSAAVRIKVKDGFRVHLTLEELKKLEATECRNPILKRAFLFACFSGLRLSDVENLSWDAVNLQESFIEYVQKKTGTAEHLTLGEQAIEILKEQAKESQSGKVFPLPPRATAWKMLRAWGKAAKVDKPMSFHKSRHSFAMLSLGQGADIFVLSSLMGHASVQSTQIYAHVLDEAKKKAVAMLPTLKDTKQE